MIGRILMLVRPFGPLHKDVSDNPAFWKGLVQETYEYIVYNIQYMIHNIEYTIYNIQPLVWLSLVAMAIWHPELLRVPQRTAPFRSLRATNR